MFKEFLEIPLPSQWWYVFMLVWVVFWKGMALWKSSRLGQKWWFIALLLINTFGILEIFYIYVFSKKQAALHKARRSEDLVPENHSRAHTTSILENAEPIEEKKEEKKESTEGTASSA
jgi:hypothetical protein